MTRTYETSLPRSRAPFVSSYAGYHQSEYPARPNEIFDGGTPSDSTILEARLHPRIARYRSRRRAARVLRIRHVRNEVERIGERLVVERAAPVVVDTPVVAVRAGILAQPRHYGGGELTAGAMHGIDRLTSERRERVLVADVKVLEVELDSVEAVVAAERGESSEAPARARLGR